MPTIASSALTFLDMTDHNQLSAYLSSNFSTVQTCTSNGQIYNPSWSSTTPLKIQLHAFLNQIEIDYTDTSKYTITWYVQDGINQKTEISSAKNQRELIITSNELGKSTSGMLSYWCCVKLDDTNYVESQITYTLISEAKTVTFSVYAPNGNVFVNQSGTLDLATNKYYGTNEIYSGATFQWYKYQDAQWVAITGATNDTFTVNGSDVVNIASYKCIMTYNDAEYVGIATLQDKSDTYMSEIYTIGGNIFKNGVGGSATYIIVRTNSHEVDVLAGPISATAPPYPVEGDYWYCIDASKSVVIPKRYNGAAWGDYNIPQSLTYIWSIMDKNGNQTTFKDGSTTKTGKVIYVSCADIADTCTLHCEVTQE